MLIDSQEGSGEGAFQALDNIVRISESNTFDLYSQFKQLPPIPDSASAFLPDATITPDGITFNSPTMSGMENSLSQMLPALDGVIGALSSMPGGAGLLMSFFQALGALFVGVAQTLGQTALELSQSYAQAAQSAIDMSKMLKV